MAKRELESTKDLREKFPSNSFKRRDSEKDISEISKSEPEESAPKGKRIANGRVRKQGPVRKFLSYIITDTLDTTKERVLSDVIIPGVQGLVYDAVVGTVETMLFGNSERPLGGYRRASVARRGGRTSYDKYYDEKGGRRARSESYRNMPKDPDEIILDTRQEAREALEELDYVIQKYGQATIADFYDIVGVTSEFTDNKYGWTSLRNASIKPVRDGFMITLPRTELLDY